MKRFYRWLSSHVQFFTILEATLVITFLIQALRFMIGAYYGRIAGLSITSQLPMETLQQLVSPGLVLPQQVLQELTILLIALLFPLLAIILGRMRFMMSVVAILTASFRVLMLGNPLLSPPASSALTVGMGLLYFAYLIRHRVKIVPASWLFAITLDLLIRAIGNTLDPTWSSTFFYPQLGLLGVICLVAILNLFNRIDGKQTGLLNTWSGMGLGTLVFLEITLLSSPNAVSAWSNVPFNISVPVLVGATLLPLLPNIRQGLRQLFGFFDPSVRGWIMMLAICFALVIGNRIDGWVGLIGLASGQLLVSSLWWWYVRPKADKEFSLSGLWIVGGLIVFAIFFALDLFTYEYAYVRDFADPRLSLLNDSLIPSLRGMRGLGLPIALLAALMATLPMIQSHKRHAWQVEATQLDSLLLFVLIALVVGVASYVARPTVIRPLSNTDNVRVGTYNIHGGFNEFFHFDLEAIAQTIEASGADIVLLQEIEAGRLTSYGVDQPLWLARRLKMDVRYFPTNEALYGLAVLSKAEIVFNDGILLPSVGQQTGLQRVQVRIRPNDNTSIITLYNTWLGLLIDSIGSKSLNEQEQDQQQQLNGIIAQIQSHHPDRVLGRTVLGGTFNNVPDSPLIASVRSLGFADPFDGAPLERSATLVRLGIQARVDYLWLYPNLFDGNGRMPNPASDHRLAFVNLLME
ncbi:MAG: endonuclease/exonuclease/phosphatase family protein [Phototrophicaceae bacterium]